jgi:hypothetical protein
MFDLEQAISQWRREMRADGIADAETLDELESHLRDDVEDQTRSGSDLQLSFEAALTRMGQRAALQKEFQKVTVTRLILRLKQAFRALAGIPDYQLAMNMNASGTNPNFEVRWATYAKAAAFLAPALALWAFSCVFLVPKLKQISGNAGLALPTLLQMTLFASSHYVLIAAALVFSIILLEWRSNKWPRYRRTTLGMSVFVINTLILLVITTMVFWALLTAQAMAIP